MKYQFQFAGANVSRARSPQKKRLRLVLLAAAFLLAGLACWLYFHHLAQEASAVLPTVGGVAAPVVAKKTATLAATAAQLPATVKNATAAALTTVGHNLAEAVKISPVAPVQKDQPIPRVTTPTVATPIIATPTVAVPPAAAPATVVPVAKPQAIPVCVPVMRVTSEPPPQRPTRVHTPQELLERAGMTAFENVLESANKYPDAYGFRAEDAFSKAKLGEPIPVYTITEADRAKYQSGQALKPLLKETRQWVFPVLVGDRICCMVQVKFSGNEYVPEKSSKSLGLAWGKIRDRWPSSEGYHPCIVINPEIPGYFFTVPELPTPNMTDIVRLSDYQPSLSPADVILASWR